MQFVVEPDGRTSSHRVLLSEPRGVFDEAAVKALGRWRFEPGPDNPGGEAAVVTQVLDFALADRPAVKCRADSNGATE